MDGRPHAGGMPSASFMNKRRRDADNSQIPTGGAPITLVNTGCGTPTTHGGLPSLIHGIAGGRRG